VIHYIALQGNSIRASNNYQQYMQNKFLQVEIKRNGAFGGIKWIIGNYKNISRPSWFFVSVKQLLSHNKLTKRKNFNFFTYSNIDEYYNKKICEHLNETLPFLVEYPIHSPKKLTFFVTKRCNATCQHCFLKIVKNKNKELKKEAIIRIVSSLNKGARISLTGGEPFLREDLGEIIHKLMSLSVVEALAVTTNGSLPNKIDTICRKVTDKHKKPFHVQISLDGLENTHNSIRNLKNGFLKAIETISRLNRLKNENSNFSYVIAITLMKQNMPEIEELVDYLQNHKYLSKISIVRGNSFSTFRVPKDVLDFECEPNVNSNIDTKEIKKIIENIKTKHPKYFNKFQKQKLEIMLNTLDSKKRLIPCYAGYEDLVIYSDGNISLCEQVISFGNLAEWNWDLLKAWNSTIAMENRVKLTHCSCLHGCNINTSIRKQNKSKIFR
jgi:MoaA/NifB/PqqE/SkfB family radical SAM enzyme